MKKKKLLQHVVCVVGTHPGPNAAEQGLTLLGGRDVMLSLWYSDSQLKNGSSVNSDHFDATDLRL